MLLYRSISLTRCPDFSKFDIYVMRSSKELPDCLCTIFFGFGLPTNSLFFHIGPVTPASTSILYYFQMQKSVIIEPSLKSDTNHVKIKQFKWYSDPIIK